MTSSMNLSFAGCGFLGLYHAGVAVCLKKYASHIHLNNISGASAGALAACSLLCDMSPEDFINDVLDMVQTARNRTLGPFSPSFNLNDEIRKKLMKIIPEDAHIQVGDRLRVSLTRVCDGKNVIISDFQSKEELIDCLLASSFVPVFSGLVPPKFRGVRYIDGMFTDNLPRLDEHTITVSPFSGESDICPRDHSTALFHMNFSNTSIAMSLQNIFSFITIVWPPKTEVLADLCKQGFDDALRFLQRNNHISCTRCLSIQSTYVISEEEDECTEYDPQCEKCEERRQEAMMAALPEVVESVFQGYIDAANKGLYNWLLSHRGMKVITLLTLPYTIPIDCAYAFIIKMKDIVPHMVSNLRTMSKFLMEEFLGILEKVSSKAGYKLSATLKMEYDIGSDAKPGSDKEIKVDFHVNDNSLDMAKLKSSGVLSRRGSLALKTDAVYDFDTYDNILQVTSHHDSILAFYYTDENNKLRVTEIFDVTSCLDEPPCHGAPNDSGVQNDVWNVKISDSKESIKEMDDVQEDVISCENDIKKEQSGIDEKVLIDLLNNEQNKAESQEKISELGRHSESESTDPKSFPVDLAKENEDFISDELPLADKDASAPETPIDSTSECLPQKLTSDPTPSSFQDLSSSHREVS